MIECTLKHVYSPFYSKSRSLDKVHIYSFALPVSWPHRSDPSLYKLLLLFRYRTNHFTESFQIESDSSCQFSVFLHSSLIEELCATFWHTFFHEFSEDTRSGNRFELHPKTF